MEILEASKAFREYDIRGVFGSSLTPKMGVAIGFALSEEMAKRGVRTLSVGRDARLSGKTLFDALTAGILAFNESQNLVKDSIEIYDIGLLPTPVGYYSVFTEKFDANIMITGSHNPKEYNGFKITIFKDSLFGRELAVVGERVKEILASDMLNFSEILESKTEQNIKKFDILTPYVEFFKSEFKELKNSKIPFIIDCGNGTAGVTTTEICSSLNLNATILYKEPDGNFPNHHPDPSISENLAHLKEAMAKSGVKLGFAFDGDSDRIAVITPKREIKGDELACLFSLNIKNPKVIGEVKCSKVMFDFINARGVAVMGRTGHSNIKKAIKENGYDLGAEVSGHIYFKERFFGFDDAVYAMFRVLELVSLGYDLDAELDKLPKVFSTDEIKVDAGDELKFRAVDELIKRVKNGALDAVLPEISEICEIDGIRVTFQNGWALARASNTTPIIVTRFEADTVEFRDELERVFSEILREILSEMK